MTYDEASRISRERQNCGMSKQTFAFCPKIRSIDEALRSNPGLRDRVYEVHPEVSFRAWNGGAAMTDPKKTLTGGSARLRLVSAHFGDEAFGAVRANYSRRDVADDDILDAFAALWTAERIAAGRARTLPEQPQTDDTGLPMRIVY
jgi:predicted RNase H-like nuclease